jgi:hypothetical protein
MKKTIGFTLLFAIIGLAYYSSQQKVANQQIENAKNIKKAKKKVKIAGMGIGAESDPQNMRNWFASRLVNPETGMMPPNIRSKELEFAKSLPQNESLLENFVARGPYNVGGRTRAMALDVTDENVIIAGGVSGGIWKTEDQGDSWNKLTSQTMLHNVTCISQDTREGHTDTWYYGTGEAYGNSASGNGSYFFGNGMYKSTDNGETWESLVSTASETPTNFDDWDLVWDVEVNHAIDSIDQVFAAIYGGIYRSDDGGLNWDKELGGTGNAYFTEVEVSDSGVVYACLSSDAGADKGIWRSTDGMNWMNILPDAWANVYDRIKVAINPFNSNEMYVIAVTPDQGQASMTFSDELEWTSLWKYTYVEDDSTSQHGVWEDLSEFIPANSIYNFNNFYAQGSYNMTIAVSPTDSNTVFLGGTNLYVSTDGFTSHENIKQIGGYEVNTAFPDFQIYENHHPDQHEVAFIPSDPNKLLNANDGGVFLTDNYLDEVVSWNSLNNGYQTTQLYTATINEKNATSSILGGFQDNGNFFTNSENPTDPWIMPLNGDGAFAHLSADEEINYLSIQKGKIFKIEMDESGNRQSYRRIDPIGAEDYAFIHPFVVDPNNEDIMYLPEGNKLWRNSSLSSIELTNEWDSISQGWSTILEFDEMDDNMSISSISVSSENPPHRLYIGTSKRDLYRVDSAHTDNPIVVDITSRYAPGQGMATGDYFSNNAHINNIAIHPNDGDVAMAVFSNYGIYSLYYTTNAGDDWHRASGNLEESPNGFGDGPSCRWASIMPFGDDTLYFVSTSTGLYATDVINGDETTWTQMGVNSIGNVVCEQVKTRAADSLLVLASHGTGIYTAKIQSASDVVELTEVDKVEGLVVYPNPATDYISVKLSELSTCYIYNLQGKLVLQKEIQDLTEQIDVSDLPKGVYVLKVGDRVSRWVKS